VYFGHSLALFLRIICHSLVIVRLDRAIQQPLSSLKIKRDGYWIPAFAGMTIEAWNIS